MIHIRGARQHNLKNVDLDIPHNKLIVITGLSGSGKSTLAFDTLYAEGQRRYVESLSVYARQFLTRMAKPEVDLIEGLSPAIAIEQSTMGHNPRSTVGTATEIYDYLRLLFSRVGVVHCHRCGNVISSISIDQILDSLFQFPNGLYLLLLSPVVRNQSGSHSQLIKRLKREGFSRVRIDGAIMDIDKTDGLVAKQKHTIDVVVDRMVLNANIQDRLADSLELGLSLSGGLIYVELFPDTDLDPIHRLVFSEKARCLQCGIDALELSPTNFSFNSPEGACPQCNGLGSLSLPDPVKDVMPKDQNPDDQNNTQERKTSNQQPCPSCLGARLRQESRAVTINQMPIHHITALSVHKALIFFRSLNLYGQQRRLAEPILKGIIERLEFLCDVGLPYLTLDRSSQTLSRGESQRIRLATQIGAKLTGVLYVMDEPSIGLHPRDNSKLLKLLSALRDLGNTVLVVEHDTETIKAADHIIDIGPGAGIHGGQVIFQGPPEALYSASDSLTGQYYSGKLQIEMPDKRRCGSEKSISMTGVSHNNLKSISVSFPLGTLICITGVSGSGKSSLVVDTLYPVLAQKLYGSRLPCGHHQSIEGIEDVDKVIHIDQTPIGRSQRSNPATSTGLFAIVRDLFAKTADARVRGYRQNRFSFNTKGGRCEACKGEGLIKIEMQFLPDVYVSCDICRGKRYNRETLEVRYKGKNIAEVLDITVNQALSFFQNIPSIKEKLQAMAEAGLGYLHLGQSARALSGGEAQRIKLARELSKKSTGRTLYILDEPTTGLHMDDIQRLLMVLQRLVDNGNTVVVIEHNLDVIKCADHLIDLGPEGGDKGGYVLGCGTPEAIACMGNSYTGQYLQPVLMGDGN